MDGTGATIPRGDTVLFGRLRLTVRRDILGKRPAVPRLQGDATDERAFCE
jgi:hypothetical protein